MLPFTRYAIGLVAIAVAISTPDELAAQYCYSCNVCDYDFGQHVVPHEQMAVIGVNEFPHVFCAYPLNCTQGAHTYCEVFGMELPTWESVQLASSASVLADRLSSHFEAVEINYDRQALQVFGCGGQLIASYPLHAAQLAMLQDFAPAPNLAMLGR